MNDRGFPRWPLRTDAPSPRETGSERYRLPARAVGQLRHFVSTVAFWGAIALPALYVPLLLRGLESLAGLGLFLALFGLHVLALIGGRAHYD